MSDEEMTSEQKAEAREDAEKRYSEATRMKIWSRDDTGHDLSVEEMLFVRSFIIDREPVAALRRLGYGGEPARLKNIAKRYLANPEVQSAVDTLAQRICKKLEVTAERVIGQLAAMAFFDPRSVMRFNGISMDILDSSLWSDEQIAAISSVKQTKDAGVEIKLVDKLQATLALGKQLNLLEDPDDVQKKQAAEAAAEAAIGKMVEVFERVENRKREIEQQTTLQ